MRRGLRIGVFVLAGLLILAIGAGAIFLATFDPNSEKPKIVALVKQATGRDIALNGPIHLKLTLLPTLQVSDVSFANPPGFSRPQMATLQGLELQLRLLPLLSRQVEIARLVLLHPDIQLETNQQGQPNWQLTPQTTEPQPARASAAAPATSNPASPSEVVSIQELRIEDGTVTYRDDRNGQTSTLDVQAFSAAARSPDAPLHMTANATVNGTGFTLTADTGSLTRLQDPDATTPWPVKVALQTGSATLGAEGALIHPQQGRGYTLTLTGAVPDVAALAPLMPAVRLPPLHDVTFSAKIADQGQPLPAISSLTLHAGAADLNTMYPGLNLTSLDVTAAAADQPGKASATVRVGDTPISLDATFGAPALLMPQTKAAGTFPLDVTVHAAGATVSAKGQIAQPAKAAGVKLAVIGQIPDLAALSPLAGKPLPDIKTIALEGAVSDAAGGFSNGVSLDAIKLTTPDGDLNGQAALQFGPRPTLTANLTSTRVDLDALEAALKPPAPAAGPHADAPPPPLPKPRDRSGHLFSDQPLPWDALRQADADVTLAVAVLHAGGADTKTVAAHLLLRDGKLQLDPVSAELPAGRMAVKAEVDAGANPPPVSLFVHAPGLPLRPLLVAFGEAATATGNLEVYADLHGTGDTPHAIAASLDGSLGLALANGTIDNRLLGASLAKILQQINALDLVGRGGTSDVRCFAERLQFQHGDGTMQTFALSSSLLTMTGSGSINLGNETLALLMKPQARVGGTGLVIPIRVTGSILSPATRIDSVGAAEDNAGTVAGAVIGNATPLGLLGGLLGADKLLGGSGDVCTGPLALARGNPPPAQGAEPASKPKPSGAAGVLQQLFR